MEQSSTPLTMSKYYHAVFRPVIMQVLRAQGFYSSQPGVVDFLTELAAQYMVKMGEQTRLNAEHNHPWTPDPSVTDVRQAMEFVGAFERIDSLEKDEGELDSELKGIEAFRQWFDGPKAEKINRVAEAFQQLAQTLEPTDGMKVEKPPRDYLSLLKLKHSKNDQDSKYAGTVLGKSTDHGEVVVEGGPYASAAEWAKMMHERNQRPPSPDLDSRPPSSGLSSLDDGDVEMMEL
ncbi:uncharacterized protein JN550_010291 [Neoarthrinium moseri]|uniref:uncharacterized protein n=1 Tax=Neoarthrinium moseri TaxID=1658444 RepID=UPI001FDD5EB4|nr:uncharacterized protein JN550_010291 [Neoarthrinium moseri]KAI1862284.1 hypothetical protein JN550_010291 [Neoarthrinium moseri]